jgi:hypothetical protein|nr:MAG TPA: hypothetical protein [Caudoviricetes sp.]
MKDFKGTPGPWRFDEQETLSGGTVFYIAQDDNAKYTTNYSDVSQTCSGELKHIQKANAQLIAAAPELLEALQRYESVLSNIPLEFCDVEDLLYARAAINKALGE